MALIDAAGSLVGDVVSGIGRKKEGEANRAWQTSENIIMREREDNAHQREAADLEKAGVNRLMTGSIGGGSAAGMGGVTPAASMAVEVGQGIASIPKLNAEVENLNANTAGTEAETVETMQYTEWQKMDQNKQIEEINAKINNMGLEAGEIEAATYKLITDKELSEKSIMLQEAQRALIEAETETETKEALRVSNATALMAQQIENLIQEKGVSEAEEEKIRMEMQLSESQRLKVYAEIERQAVETKIANQDSTWAMKIWHEALDAARVASGFMPFAGGSSK